MVECVKTYFTSVRLLVQGKQGKQYISLVQPIFQLRLTLYTDFVIDRMSLNVVRDKAIESVFN